MTKGFYNLTSGILSQSRRLDTVANNMTNLSTSGYKAEQYTDSTFQEVLISRVGNKDKSSPTVIGEESYILVYNMHAQQLRIAEHVATVPEDAGMSPLKLAMIQDNNIVLTDYVPAQFADNFAEQEA